MCGNFSAMAAQTSVEASFPTKTNHGIVLAMKQCGPTTRRTSHMLRNATILATLILPVSAMAAPSAQSDLSPKDRLINAALEYSNIDELANALSSMEKDDCEVTDIDFARPEWQVGVCTEAYGFTSVIQCENDGIVVFAEAIVSPENLHSLAQDARRIDVTAAAAQDEIAWLTGQRDVWYEINGNVDVFTGEFCGEQHGQADDYASFGHLELASGGRRGTSISGDYDLETQHYEVDNTATTARTGTLEMTQTTRRGRELTSDYFMDGVAKKRTDIYPFAGAVGLDGRRGPYTLHFSEQTPITGEALFTTPKGGAQTVFLPLPDES
jgi:hypothetical protein